MHLAESFIDGFQPLADLGETLVELLVQGLGEAIVDGFAHFGKLALIFQAEVVDLFLLVSSGKQDLTLHALEEGRLALAHLGEGAHESLVGVVDGLSGFVELSVEFVEELVAKIDDGMFLGHAGAFLLMRQVALADEQDDQ